MPGTQQIIIPSPFKVDFPAWWRLNDVNCARRAKAPERARPPLGHSETSNPNPLLLPLHACRHCCLPTTEQPRPAAPSIAAMGHTMARTEGRQTASSGTLDEVPQPLKYLHRRVLLPLCGADCGGEAARRAPLWRSDLPVELEERKWPETNKVKGRCRGKDECDERSGGRREGRFRECSRPLIRRRRNHV